MYDKKGNKSKTIKILENAMVIYKEGDRELFDAILITDKEVIIGRIFRIDKKRKCKEITCCEVFVESGGIPKKNIKCIEGGSKKVVYVKES